ncbi:MAG: rod shape-determining protein RodA, partial [Spirochaeta sp.]|nr:rod shape-determining protein RodA [Spirochaeta sp.]
MAAGAGRMKRVSLFSFDFILLSATLVLTVIGVLFIYSSNITSTGLVFSNEYIKQLIWALSGCILLALFTYFSHTHLRNLSLHIYGSAILLLLITALIGKEVSGARSWLGIGDYGIQPSEFAKLAVILFLAAYLRGVGNGVRELPRFVLGFGIALLPMGLILLQPDMGTALVFLPIFLVMVFMAGARLRHIFFICAAGALVVVLSVLPA